MSSWSAGWQSSRTYEHPAPHQAGTFGRVIRSDSGAYRLQVGAGYMSCPQDWAARIEHDEQDWQDKIRRAIALLEKTKTAFRSADVAEAREILEELVK